MLTLMIVLMTVFALGARWRGRRKLEWAAVAISLALLVMGGTGQVSNLLLSYLQNAFPPMSQPQWGSRNAVVILGAGMEPPRFGQPPVPTMWGDSRVLEGLRLYRACRAEGHTCVVLVSGGDPHHMGVSEAETYGRLLIELGLDPADLRLETQSLNTFKNAELSVPLLRAEKVERVVVVTSGLHEKRALLFFSHFGVQAQGCASDAVWAQSGWIPLAMNLTLMDLALHEHLGMMRYRVYQAMGWNPARTKAGEA